MSHPAAEQGGADITEAQLTEAQLTEADVLQGRQTVDQPQQVGHCSCPCLAVRQVQTLQQGEPRPGQELHGAARADPVLVDGHLGPEDGRAGDVVEISRQSQSVSPPTLSPPAGQEDAAQLRLKDFAVNLLRRHPC